LESEKKFGVDLLENFKLKVDLIEYDSKELIKEVGLTNLRALIKKTLHVIFLIDPFLGESLFYSKYLGEVMKDFPE
jgi:hypothetical protein